MSAARLLQSGRAGEYARRAGHRGLLLRGGDFDWHCAADVRVPDPRAWRERGGEAHHLLQRDRALARTERRARHPLHHFPAVREVLRYLGIDRGLSVHHQGDLPARSGIGSSSAFTVGIMHALYALQGQMVDKLKLAQESIYIEQEVLKETVGSQDQISVACGGFNHVTFSQSGEMTIMPLTIKDERVRDLNNHLMLFYTGIERTAADIAQSYVHDIQSKSHQLNLMAEMVSESISILNSEEDLTRFGKLLGEAWKLKRSLSTQVSSTIIDQLYDLTISAGAIGGKITGAGGGGFLLVFAEPDKHENIKKNLKKLIHVPFQFEFSGSQIIFFDSQ